MLCPFQSYWIDWTGSRTQGITVFEKCTLFLPITMALQFLTRGRVKIDQFNCQNQFTIPNVAHSHKSTRERERINQKQKVELAQNHTHMYIVYGSKASSQNRSGDSHLACQLPKTLYERCVDDCVFASIHENISFVCVKKLIFLWLKRENNCSFRSPCHVLLLRKFWVLRGFSILFDRTTTRYISHIVCVCLFCEEKTVVFFFTVMTLKD